MAYATRIKGFSGAVPKQDYRLLPDGAAAQASDAFLVSGRIDPMYTPALITQSVVGANVKSIFRMSSGGTDYWLSWNADVDVVRSPIAGDTAFKIAFTSDSYEPRQTNLALATQTAAPYPNAWYVLGVFPPSTALTATPTGGSGTLETRAYVYTFVTPWGEESAPSPASTLATGYPNATWALTAMQVAPPNNGTISAAAYSSGSVLITLNSVFGLRAGEQVTFSGVVGMTDLNNTFLLTSVNTGTNQVTVALTTAQTYTSGGSWIRLAPHNTTGMTKRMYRTALAADGTTSYYFVAEIAVATTTYNDTILGTSLGGPIATIGWGMPPTNMQGIISLPNGILAGFSSNQLCLSYPYAPYAWPLAYRLTSDYPIVAIGAFGQSVVVGTQGTPYVASGVDPSTMSLAKTSYVWPCLSKRGMISFGGNVYFPTNLGLAAIGVMGEAIVTDKLYAQYDWEALAPSTFIAGHYNGNYYAYYNSTSSGVLVVSAESGVVTIALAPSELWTDPATGELYYQFNGSIFNMNPVTGVRKTCGWLSKEFVVANPLNLGAAKIDAAFTLSPALQAAVVAWNAAVDASNTALMAGAANGIGGALDKTRVNALVMNGSSLRTDYKQTGGSIGFVLYADDNAIFSTTITDEKMFRLPAGVKYDNFQVQLSSNVPVQSIVLAETPQALKGV